MEKEQRDKYICKMKAFVKRNKKGQIKRPLEIITYLNRLLGCYETQLLTIYGKFERVTYYKETSLLKYFNPFMIIIYFPFEGLRVYCSQKEGSKITYINNIINKKFNEEAITFECIKNNREIHDGPMIIISMAISDSIILKNEKTLWNSLAHL